MAIDILKQTAIHETGHVIMAYYFGYAVNYISVDKAVPEEGRTEVLWTPDNQIVKTLLHPYLASERPTLLRHGQEYLINFAKRFIMTMVAGTAAEAVYQQKAEGASTIDSINGVDNDTIFDFIASLNSIGVACNHDLVGELFSVVMGLLRSEEKWLTLDGLSDLLLSKSNHTLQRREIENYFAEALAKK